MENGISFQGQMTKEGHIVKSWKDRYFVFKQPMLFYFENREVITFCNILTSIEMY